VKARFQVGRPEADLPAYLGSQGMGVDRKVVRGAELPIVGRAQVQHGIGICDRQATVVWRADASGVLHELRTSYAADNCI
jgi:hypothetical protein